MVGVGGWVCVGGYAFECEQVCVSAYVCVRGEHACVGVCGCVGVCKGCVQVCL